jgi:hypothetical protein
VVGIVLVDASHENSEMMLNGKVRLLRELSRGRAVPEPRLTDARDSVIAVQGAPTLDPPFDHLPASIQATRRWAMSLARYNAARSSEFDYLAEEADELAHRRAADSTPSFGNRPLVVVTPAGASGSHAALQTDLLKLSTKSRQIISSSSDHHVQLTDPDAVIAAVRLVIGDLRDK